MDLHMQSHHLTNRLPDWRAAALSGLAGGVVFLILDMLAMMISGGSIAQPFRMIAAIVMGSDMLDISFNANIVLAAAVVHFALAVAMGLILSLIIAPFHFDSSMGMASAVGAIFGILVYLINFYGMTQFFPWFAEARNWMTVVAHIVFGIVLADAYLKWEHQAADAG